MIIFYNKENGNIVGTIDGRVHTEEQLKMWIGGEENDRIVITWNPVKFYDRDGNELKEGEHAYTADFEPDHPQKELFNEIDANLKRLKDFRVDIQTKQLVEL